MNRRAGRAVHSVMRRAIAWALLLPILIQLPGCARTEAGEIPGERAIIRGVVTFNEDGEPLIEDCNRRKTVTIGGMTQGHALYLRRRHDELSRRHSQPVTAEMSGYLERTSKGLHLARATPLWVASGLCTDEADGHLDYK